MTPVAVAARLLGLRLPVPPRALICLLRALCVVRGLCDGPIPRSEEYYRLWHVIVCKLEASRMRRPWPAQGCCTRAREREGEDGRVILIWDPVMNKAMKLCEANGTGIIIYLLYLLIYLGRSE